MAPSVSDHARMLDRYGVMCMPILPDAARQRWAQTIWNAMDEFPEYKVRGRQVQRSLGGFGALGNPSSFHHPDVQKWRNRIKKKILMPLFRQYVLLKGFSTETTKLEKLYDRINVRCESFGQPTKESWHRDIYDGQKYGLRDLPRSIDGRHTKYPDEIFGGWVNLSDANQHFICIMGSHKGDEAFAAQQRGGGFAELSEKEIREQRVEERLARQANRKIGTCRTNGDGHVIVPPGAMVIFYQRLLHSVAGGKQPREPNLRIFNGVRLTGERNALFDHESVIINNAVPRIPSGQIPPMYSQNHYGFFSRTPRYRDWGASTFKNACLFERKLPSGVAYHTPGSRNDRNSAANKGRYMPSLSEMDFEPYPYSNASVQTMLPEFLFARSGFGTDADIVSALQAFGDEEEGVL